MSRQFRLLPGIAFLVIQFSCAPVSEQVVKPEQPESLAMATDTWNQVSGDPLPAVQDLIQQADAEIAMRNWDVASEKIERALRISSDYAPAWSRLSHIALYNNEPARAIQMAKRSNSYAGNLVELKLLNWEFIREASVMLNDKDGVGKADKAINILNSL